MSKLLLITRQLFLIIFIIKYFLIIESWACPANLKKWKIECKIHDDYQKLKKTYSEKNINIENVKGYRKYRFVECQSETSSTNKPLWKIYPPDPETWIRWEIGNKTRENLSEHLKSDWSLKLDDIKKIHAETINRKILGKKAIFVAQPGEVRGPDDIRAGWEINEDEVKSYKSNIIVDKHGKKLFEVVKNRPIRRLLSGKKYYLQFAHTRYAEQDTKDLLSDINKKWNFYLKGEKGSDNNLSPIEFLASSQRFFVGIHPFSEGSGRVSRFMQDLMTNSLGLPYVPAGLLQNDLTTSNQDYQKKTMRYLNQINNFLRACIDKNYRFPHHPDDNQCLIPNEENCQDAFLENPNDSDSIKKSKEEFNKNLKQEIENIFSLKDQSEVESQILNKKEIRSCHSNQKKFSPLKKITDFTLKSLGFKDKIEKFSWINGVCHAFDYKSRQYLPVKYPDDSLDKRPCMDNLGYSYVWERRSIIDPLCKSSLEKRIDKKEDLEKEILRICNIYCAGKTTENINIYGEGNLLNIFCIQQKNLLFREEFKDGKNVCVSYMPVHENGTKIAEVEFLRYQPQLSCREIQAILRYTDAKSGPYLGKKYSNFSVLIKNEHYLANFSAGIFKRQLIQDIYNGTKKLPPFEGIVFRGASKQKSHKKGDIISMNQITSTSKSIDIASEFGKTIYFFKNRSGKDISDISFIYDEEVIIPHKKKYRIIRENTAFDPEVHKSIIDTIPKEERDDLIKKLSGMDYSFQYCKDLYSHIYMKNKNSIRFKFRHNALMKHVRNQSFSILQDLIRQYKINDNIIDKKNTILNDETMKKFCNETVENLKVKFLEKNSGDQRKATFEFNAVMEKISEKEYNYYLVEIEEL